MKFEKLNNDKIKITLSSADLEANDIDFHSFMSNSTETQSLFLSVLDKAEKDFGFSTDNYALKVETLALDNGSFILTITRSRGANDKKTLISPRKKFRVSRKVPGSISSSLIYKFNTFDDFCGFVECLSTLPVSNIDRISRTSMLYSYNGLYYLILDKVNAGSTNLKVFYSSVTEFGTYVNYSEGFVAKLHESGTLVIKNHAIKVCEKYFL